MGLFSKKKNAAQDAGGVFVHPVLGDVAVVCSVRARRVTISVRPPRGAVRLTIPKHVARSEGLRFLEAKMAWVVVSRERMALKYPQAEPVLPPYSTRGHVLELRATDLDRIHVRVGGGRILVSHPHALPSVSEPVQNAIKKGIEQAWRIEANDLLPCRVAHIAREHGFRHGKITVRNTVSKWGSCSARGDLSFSLHLMRLPDTLVDYIILHELCHTVHHNHGPLFHSLLNLHTANRHPELLKELKKYNTRW